MLARWHELLRQDVKNTSVLEFKPFSVPSGLRDHVIVLLLLFSERKRKKPLSGETGSLSLPFSVLAEVSCAPVVLRLPIPSCLAA